MPERTTLGFDHARLRRQTAAEVLVYIENDYGARVSSHRRPSVAAAESGLRPVDGPPALDGTHARGGLNARARIDTRADLLSVSDLTARVAPLRSDLIGSLAASEKATVTSVHDNQDGYWSSVLGKEAFLRKTGRVTLGFLGLPSSDYLQAFRGRIRRITLQLGSVTFEQEEA